MRRKRLQELDLLRTVAIIMVVLVHAITRVMEVHHTNGGISQGLESAFLILRLIATFGTPIFVFLSEFLLSYSYDELPKDFFKKRIRYIFMPYLSMGILYAFVMTYEGGGVIAGGGSTVFITNLLRNLLFGFYRHGYFIVLIFQFYLLHYFFHNKLKNMKIKPLLLGSLGINVAYLLFFHGIDHIGIPFGEELVIAFTWGAAPAWIFYFAAGYVLGKNKEAFHRYLIGIDQKIFPLVILTGGVLVTMNFSGLLTINSSKRFDMIFFTSAMFLLLYRYARKNTYSKKITGFISRYSFGIYLLHMLFLFIITEYLIALKLQLHPVITLFLLSLGSGVLSVLATNFISRFTWGTYVVGRLEVKHRPVVVNSKERDSLRERSYLAEH